MVEEFSELNVRAFIHRPGSRGEHGIALTHGASANCETVLLRGLSAALAEAGLTVLRYDLPFRSSRPSGPPRPNDAAKDREGILAVCNSLRRLVNGRVLAGGHSYGGRQTSMVAVETPEMADGLVLLSYPLHPPKHGSEHRTSHFPGLQPACLFVHGTRDPFGSPEEMRSAITAVPGKTELYLVERAGHDLNPSKSVEAIAARIMQFAAYTFR
jgi:uncharacterized protein